MDKLTVKYRFTRINNSVVGFTSSNQASTDALTALLRWKAGAQAGILQNLLMRTITLMSRSGVTPITLRPGHSSR